MQNYKDLGLQDNLIKLESPIAQTIDPENSIEDGTVRGIKVADKSLNLKKLYGQDLELGGSSNISGRIRNYDNQMRETTRMDYLGFHNYDTNGNEITKLDNLGLHNYDTLAHEITKVDTTGLHSYDTSAHELTRVDTLGFHEYDTSGNELVKVDASGFHNYDASGHELVRTDITGFHTYDTSGNEITKSTDTGYILRNTRGLFMEETTLGEYWDLHVSNDNKAIMSLPSTNQFYMYNHENTDTLFTVSNDQVFSNRKLSIADGHVLWLGLNNGVPSGSPADGWLYVDTSDGTIRYYYGGDWYSLDMTIIP